MIGEIAKNTPLSAYKPSKEICDFTNIVRQDFAIGDEILNKPYTELNDLSVIERMNRDQRTFNAFVDESVEDPKEAWKWRGTRSKARNKAVAMHAQITAGYIVPMFMAQNDADEEDRMFSDVMRDIIDWMVHNSSYKSSFLMTVMGMLVNPVTYLGAEYAEVYQIIREKTEKGYSKKEILDEVLSGFQAPVYSADQILITNAHEQNIQRQRAILKRRYIDYSEAEAKYGSYKNWPYVMPGMKSIYSESDGLFYDIKDDAHPTLVEEVTYLNRREDTEVCFIGGIYMGAENIEDNPIRHRDNRNAPKYNVVPFGYQRINEHFFYFKSLTNAQYWDNQLIDAQYEVTMNRALFDANVPVAITGTDKVDADISYPASVHAFADPQTKVTPIFPQSNLSNLFAGIGLVEKSMDESSVSDVSSGQLPTDQQTATAVSVAQQNAKTLLQGVGKTLAESIVQYGGLMADIAVNHITIPQVEELSGGKTKLKYRTLILKNKTVGGRNVSKVIKFDDSLLGAEMSDTEKNMAGYRMLEESGYPENDQEVYRINPELFARQKYLTYVEPERMFSKNEEFMQAMATQLYNLFKDNQYISLEALTRETAYPFWRGKTDELMQKPQVNPEVPASNGGNMPGNMAVSQALSKGLARAGA